MKSHTQLKIEIIDGTLAPRYPNTTKELEVTKAIITTQGTVAQKPIVDFQLQDKDGNEFFICMTGGLFINLAATIEGASSREYKMSDKPTN